MLLEAGVEELSALKLAVKNGHSRWVELLLTKAGPDLDISQLLEEAIRVFKVKRDEAVIGLLLSDATNDCGDSDVNTTILLEAALLTDNPRAVTKVLAGRELAYSSRLLDEAVFLSYRTGDHSFVRRLLDTREPSPNDALEVAAVASWAVKNDMELLRTLMSVLRGGPWSTTVLDCFGCSPKDVTYLGLCVDGNIYLTREDDGDFSKLSHVLEIAAGFDSARSGNITYQNLTNAGVSEDGFDRRKVQWDWPKWTPGADPNPPQTRTQATPLELAIYHGDEFTVKALLESGAFVNIKPNMSGRDHWHGSMDMIQLALEFGNPAIIGMLLNHGVHVNSPAGYNRGATCLQLAAGTGAIGIVRLLLDKGAEVNAKRSFLFGRTAIEAAAENGRLDVLSLLLLRGQNLLETQAQRFQSTRAIKFAEDGDHKAVANMLREHMGVCWDDNDRRRFMELDVTREIVLDDMTQKPSDFERSDPGFFHCNCHWRDLDAVMQWMGSDPAEEYELDEVSSENDISCEVLKLDVLSSTTPCSRPRDHGREQVRLLDPEAISSAPSDVHQVQEALLQSSHTVDENPQDSEIGYVGYPLFLNEQDWRDGQLLGGDSDIDLELTG